MGELPITMADVIVVLVLIVSGLLAFARGFVHEVLAVGGWIGALFATIYGLPLVRPYARQLVDNTTVADVGAGLVLFLLSLVILSLFTSALAQRVRGSRLNALDRSLGFVFGLVRGAVLIAILYIALDWLMPGPRQPEWVREARSMPLVEAGADALKSLIPAAQVQQGETAAQEAVDDARKALETQRMLREMMTPEPKAPMDRDGSGAQGYTAKERREFERLLESSQGRN